MKLSGTTSYDYKDEHIHLKYKDTVDHCPICLSKGQPKLRSVHNQYPSNQPGKNAWLTYQCPSNDCQKIFIAEFTCIGIHPNSIYQLKNFFPKNIVKPSFPEAIDDVSEQFKAIYTEASEAEQLGLTNICGPGYRKALEFLIKDYCIWLNPSNEKAVKGKLLAQVIRDFVTDSRINSAASKAVWLGNDETHYERKWLDKDINDMKTLIRLVILFIESEALMKKYETEMT